MLWVVTDHAETRTSLVPLIASKQYEVAEIECGDEVRKRIQFQAPTLVIIDCAMPDSFDMLAIIRAQPRQKPIPIIMFSKDDEHLKEKALLQGANAYVPKGSMDWAELLLEVVRFAGPPN